MFQINNHTPFKVELHPTFDLYGRDFLVVVIKGSYLITPGSEVLGLAKEQVKIQHEDEYYAEAGRSSIKTPSDLAAAKPATDVILQGQAYTPGGNPLNQCDVTITVANRQQTLRVFGDRFWQKRNNGWSISTAAEFTQLPLQYEFAYGGFDQFSDQQAESPECDAFNPCGKGYFPPDGEPFNNLALPNIENPQALIRTIDDRPRPVGFGAIARDWQPRRALAGTYDSDWQENRMPLLPKDFNLGFYNSAHPDLQFTPHLTGDERVTITNASALGLLSFNLPAERLSVATRIRSQQKYLITELDTLVIQPDEQLLTLTWRCSIACAGKLLYVDSVDITRELHANG